ncbi:MAG TPA: gluconokinase [Nostocaceae cyanobacterium]|nr:gluconokinase [Nostocaceae cyanobacterium]
MIILITGVSGSGKTTIAQQLAKSLNWEFRDADDFHSTANIEKMRSGIPLTDADRMPWLQTLQAVIKVWLKENKNATLACSALKASYRQILLIDNQIQLVYLKGAYELVQKRLQERQNHFMTEKLLQSQFNTLEEPDNAICVDISQPQEAILQQIKASLRI